MVKKSAFKRQVKAYMIRNNVSYISALKAIRPIPEILSVESIVGIPGIGKTTLLRERISDDLKQGLKVHLVVTQHSETIFTSFLLKSGVPVSKLKNLTIQVEEDRRNFNKKIFCNVLLLEKIDCLYIDDFTSRTLNSDVNRLLPYVKKLVFAVPFSQVAGAFYVSSSLLPADNVQAKITSLHKSEDGNKLSYCETFTYR